MDVVAIEGRDERGVEQLHGLVRDSVGGVLGVLDELDARRAILLDFVIAQDVDERAGAVDDELRVVVEQAEKTPLSRHETGDEVHSSFPAASGSSAECSGFVTTLSQDRYKAQPAGSSAVLGSAASRAPRVRPAISAPALRGNRQAHHAELAEISPTTTNAQ